MQNELDWKNIGFSYRPLGTRYISIYRDGAWDAGELTKDANITISESASVLQYAQTCFEGLKAYKTHRDEIVVFRPDLNAQRMAMTCERLMMPAFPVERFVDAVKEVVCINAEYVPPYGSGASLYIRPFQIGIGPVLGVAPASEYMFRIFVSPVGPYFKSGIKPIRVRISEYDRAAPKGTGHIKAGLNYAMSLYPGYVAKQEGFDENLYLDAATRTKIEETGGANVVFITKDQKLVTPKSDTILPSITRQSLLHVAKEYLHMECQEREVLIDEVKSFAECGLCGTAAVIAPVGSIHYNGKDIFIPSGMEQPGPVLSKLYKTLTNIQSGVIQAPNGWLQKI